MTLLDRLERRFGRFAVPHVTEGLIACQVLAYIMSMGQPEILKALLLTPQRVLEGQWWRLFTFVCQPPVTNLLFAFFFWYLFFLMGTALENTWGTFRYNVYLLIGWAATVAVSFLQPQAPASILFLQGSVFLAFAYLYPDFQLLLFFLLPVKVKWLALLEWLAYAWMLLFGDLATQLLVAAAICNFVLFFWRNIILRMKSGRRRMSQQAQRIRTANAPRHRCVVCGATNLSHPRMSFRYCSKCAGALLL